MAFDWREYLALSQWLQANTPPGMSQEAAHRCAISRAYFAAYGYALHYATQYLEFVPPDGFFDALGVAILNARERSLSV